MSTPVGPYSPTTRAGDWLVVSGQVGLGPDGLADGFAAQLTQALENLRGLVEGAGLALGQVAKTTVFLVTMDDYAEMNAIYTEFFDRLAGGHRPARSAVAVAALPIGAVVEIEAWVYAGIG
jgi:2-iminobutanoate/2-iminopropanoate deaminase